MRAYTVQPGDSPAKIAIAFAGCPKCARDLLAANPGKPTRRYPNGYETFTSLDVGERLQLPERWFDGTLDAQPAEYFAALPSVDGGGGMLGASPLTTLAQLQGQASSVSQTIAAAPAAVQQQYQQALDEQNSSGVSNAFAAMLALVEKGSFDPQNPADMQAVIDITAGAFTAAALPEIGAAIEILDGTAHAIAAGLEAVGIIQPSKGWTSGQTWTAATVLQAWGWPAVSAPPFAAPPVAPFALVAVPIFAKYAADAINGKSTPANALILEALANLWNLAGSSVPGVDCYAPGWFAAGGAGLGVPGVAGVGFGSDWATEIAWAFSPATSLPSGFPSQFADPFTSRVSLNAGPSHVAAPSHGAPVYTPSSGSSSANGSSSAGAVVAGTAAVAAAGFSLYALLTKQSLEQAGKHLYRQIRGG